MMFLFYYSIYFAVNVPIYIAPLRVTTINTGIVSFKILFAVASCIRAIFRSGILSV